MNQKIRLKSRWNTHSVASLFLLLFVSISFLQPCLDFLEVDAIEIAENLNEGENGAEEEKGEKDSFLFILNSFGVPDLSAWKDSVFGLCYLMDGSVELVTPPPEGFQQPGFIRIS